MFAWIVWYLLFRLVFYSELIVFASISILVVFGLDRRMLEMLRLCRLITRWHSSLCRLIQFDLSWKTNCVGYSRPSPCGPLQKSLSAFSTSLCLSLKGVRNNASHPVRPHLFDRLDHDATFRLETAPRWQRARLMKTTKKTKKLTRRLSNKISLQWTKGCGPNGVMMLCCSSCWYTHRSLNLWVEFAFPRGHLDSWYHYSQHHWHHSLLLLLPLPLITQFAVLSEQQRYVGSQTGKNARQPCQTDSMMVRLKVQWWSRRKMQR